MNTHIVTPVLLTLALSACSATARLPSPQAISQARRHCREGITASCLAAGMIEEQEGTRDALERASEFYSTGCRGDDPSACEAWLDLQRRRGVRDRCAIAEALRVCRDNDTRVCERVRAIAA